MSEFLTSTLHMAEDDDEMKRKNAFDKALKKIQEIRSKQKKTAAKRKEKGKAMKTLSAAIAAAAILSGCAR